MPPGVAVRTARDVLSSATPYNTTTRTQIWFEDRVLDRQTVDSRMIREVKVGQHSCGMVTSQALSNVKPCTYVLNSFLMCTLIYVVHRDSLPRLVS